jgi:hypothetical protein
MATYGGKAYAEDVGIAFAVCARPTQLAGCTN